MDEDYPVFRHEAFYPAILCMVDIRHQDVVSMCGIIYKDSEGTIKSSYYDFVEWPLSYSEGMDSKHSGYHIFRTRYRDFIGKLPTFHIMFVNVFKIHNDKTKKEIEFKLHKMSRRSLHRFMVYEGMITDARFFCSLFKNFPSYLPAQISVDKVSRYSLNVRQYGSKYFSALGAGKVTVVGSHIHQLIFYYKKGIAVDLYELAKPLDVMEMESDSGGVESSQNLPNGAMKLCTLHAQIAAMRGQLERKTNRKWWIIEFGAGPKTYVDDDVKIKMVESGRYVFYDKKPFDHMLQATIDYEDFNFVDDRIYVDDIYDESTDKEVMMDKKINDLRRNKSFLGKKSYFILKCSTKWLKDKNNMPHGVVLLQNHSKDEYRLVINMDVALFISDPSLADVVELQVNKFRTLSYSDQNRVLSLQFNLHPEKFTGKITPKYLDAIYSLNDMTQQQKLRLLQRVSRNGAMLFTHSTRKTSFSDRYGDVDVGPVNPQLGVYLHPIQYILHYTDACDVLLSDLNESACNLVFGNHVNLEDQGALSSPGLIKLEAHIRSRYEVIPNPHFFRQDLYKSIVPHKVEITQDGKSFKLLQTVKIDDVLVRKGTIYDVSGHQLNGLLLLKRYGIDVGYHLWSDINRKWGSMSLDKKRDLLVYLHTAEPSKLEGQFHKDIDVLMTYDCLRYLL